MELKVRGASENNLKSVDCDLGNGLTVVTGVSGSGKTSLIFDTIYHEARRRLIDIFSTGSQGRRLIPAKVRSITGLGPAVAVGQNLLNRNPLSTVASASGLHPFLRLLYARFGMRHCPECGTGLSVLTEDELVDCVYSMAGKSSLRVYAPLVQRALGSHRTLIKFLESEFGASSLLIDGIPWTRRKLKPTEPHDIQVEVAQFNTKVSVGQVRQAVQTVASLGANAVIVRRKDGQATLSRVAACVECGAWFGDLEPVHFRIRCVYCDGEGCRHCAQTGLHPQAAAVRWEELRFTDMLQLSIDEAHMLFSRVELPSSAQRLKSEIQRRLDSLTTVGLGYIRLNRSSPTLSRGESQRVRLAISLISELEDILHVLDEPTVGQHPADVARLLPAFRKMAGPVVYVEHDRVAAAAADFAIDIGPGAGNEGGELVFTGTPAELWKTDTITGRYFSLRDRVTIPESRPDPLDFIVIRGAKKHNLKGINVRIPIGMLTVISGVSGSGKSTLVEHVLVPSLKKNKAVGCKTIESLDMKPVLVDQSPIGKNPRSNPATYTKLSDIVRNLFASSTELSASHFSFNRPEGACPACKGMGAVEVKLRYLPSTWIRCSDCDGKRFNEEVLSERISFGDRAFSIADFYKLSISQVSTLLAEDERLPEAKRRAAKRLLQALVTVGLGYLTLGQPSPTLSGGESQRVKLAKYLGKMSLSGRVLVLDEPSTGLHAKDLTGFLEVLDRLVRSNATIIVVEHNTDVIRAADWVIDLGPGAGPQGGEVVYEGPLVNLMEVNESLTAKALREETFVEPRATRPEPRSLRSDCISIKNARANNLKNVNVDFRKGALTVVTGPSGSGKSSLVQNVLEAEARRRFLETLSLYERQGTKEGPEAPVDSVKGLGVSFSIIPGRGRYQVRWTVGTATGIWHHVAALLSAIGDRVCLECGEKMVRNQEWNCPRCQSTARIAQPRHFSSRTYSAACEKCHGVGTLQIPVQEKLIINPEKPLCAGAMHSPGFFPKGYLCKRYNGGYYFIQALARRYGFNSDTTPWNEMTPEAQKAFLFGDPKPLKVLFESRIQGEYTKKVVYPGFYGWIRDWDVGGSYTETRPCKQCNGSGFKPRILAVTLAGRNTHQLGQLSFSELSKMLSSTRVPSTQPVVKSSLDTIQKRLRFLEQVGLGYLHLNRVYGTLSAGEAQRVSLAGLLGSGLTSLTVILDEPTRGMHPSEVDALIGALRELRDEGNTVIVVEHDPSVINAADQLIDMGPGAGIAGGEIVAVGIPEQVAKCNTITGKWLRGERRVDIGRERRAPKSWLTVKGARENNLRNQIVRIPLGVLTGVCGPSGSGKSTLLIDTLGRALAPRKITTSVAYEPLKPGKHDEIEGVPARTIILDQTRRGIQSPAQFLELFGILKSIYAESDDAKAAGLDRKQLTRPCTACDGRGYSRTKMGFLPDAFTACETCRETGCTPEAWDVRVGGVAFPELNRLTLNEVYNSFGNHPELKRKIGAALDVGLGYLVLRQPSYTLSGGEVQRLRIAKELARKAPSKSLYILDEPTVGLHLEDVNQLIDVLLKLVNQGHGVAVIEHHPYVLAACDWLIELGPGGGPKGGLVVAEGSPIKVAEGSTLTAPYLRQVLEGTP